MNKERFFDTKWVDDLLEGLGEMGIDLTEREKDHIRAKKVNKTIDAFYKEGEDVRK